MINQAAELLGATRPELLRLRGSDLQILEYFKILKGGLAPLTNWLSLEFSAATDLQYHNHRRLHSTLGYFSPMAFEKKRLADKERFAA